jgi:hypothetical protein
MHSTKRTHSDSPTRRGDRQTALEGHNLCLRNALCGLKVAGRCRRFGLTWEDGVLGCIDELT